MRRCLGWLMLVVVLGAFACVDMQAGEVGVYDSPCYTAFSTVLLCDRETGGVDPQLAAIDGTVDEPFGCAEACQLFANCGWLDWDEVAECAAGCGLEGSPDQLACIERAGCNFIDICFNVPNRRL